MKTEVQVWSNKTNIRSTVILTTVGSPGPVGEVDWNELKIGGYPLMLDSLENGDLLVYNSQKWINQNKRKITDGGNF